MDVLPKDFNADNAARYHYGGFPPGNLDYERLIIPLRRAATALARYDTILSTLHNKDLLLAPLRSQEAVVSSRIEGTVATLDEVLKLEAVSDEENRVQRSQGFFRQEVLEVHSYKRALTRAQHLLSQGLPLSARLLKDAHSRLLFSVRGANKQPGHFKREQNYVVDRAPKTVLFVPIDAASLDDGFALLERYIHEENLDPFIQTAVAHAEFEALHPFKDGNGRVGRMLITLMMWDKKVISEPHFYISGYLEDRKDDYIEALRRVSTHGAWTEWCLFFLEAVEGQALENITTAQRIQELYEHMKERFRESLSSQWSINVLDFIFEKPVFENSDFTSRSGIPRPTAARFAKRLEASGLLTLVDPASGQRSALYAFEPLLEILRS